MHHPADAISPSLEYSTLRRRLPWKPFILGMLTTPVVYLVLYAILRVTGVFHAYYTQGSWEIEGGTGIYIVDVPFLPLALMEGDLQNRHRWLP